MKIGDLVVEFDIDCPNQKFPLGIVVPFPPKFIESSPWLHKSYDDAGLVWVHWPELGESNWCYADEVRLLNENR
jgi:hypothetical protein